MGCGVSQAKQSSSARIPPSRFVQVRRYNVADHTTHASGSFRNRGTGAGDDASMNGSLTAKTQDDGSLTQTERDNVATPESLSTRRSEYDIYGQDDALVAGSFVKALRKGNVVSESHRIVFLPSNSDSESEEEEGEGEEGEETLGFLSMLGFPLIVRVVNTSGMTHSAIMFPKRRLVWPMQLANITNIIYQYGELICVEHVQPGYFDIHQPRCEVRLSDETITDSLVVERRPGTFGGFSTSSTVVSSQMTLKEAEKTFPSIFLQDS
eukprot:TRINITY_DN2512_c1_g1_i3.p1 TRINITY_DN2512_c1_g1~~TRINITY_DN2512_c1_g1_i3.p1  ORF type:complete len:266 (-),score=63.42 TRINITY_DN2512_c1_g1_i3:263-1060(-)